MKLDDTVMVQFFGELIESYRQQIMDQEKELKHCYLGAGDCIYL